MKNAVQIPVKVPWTPELWKTSRLIGIAANGLLEEFWADWERTLCTSPRWREYFEDLLGTLKPPKGTDFDPRRYLLNRPVTPALFPSISNSSTIMVINIRNVSSNGFSENRDRKNFIIRGLIVSSRPMGSLYNVAK